jgi:hypothetical protein
MNTTMEMLKEHFGGAIMLDTKQVARVLGMNEKTIRNLGDRFSVPSVKIGGVRRFKLIDLAAVLDGGQPSTTQVVDPQVRGRGRPRKVAQEGVAA